MSAHHSISYVLRLLIGRVTWRGSHRLDGRPGGVITGRPIFPALDRGGGIQDFDDLWCFILLGHVRVLLSCGISTRRSIYLSRRA